MNCLSVSHIIPWKMFAKRKLHAYSWLPSVRLLVITICHVVFNSFGTRLWEITLKSKTSLRIISILRLASNIESCWWIVICKMKSNFLIWTLLDIKSPIFKWVFLSLRHSLIIILAPKRMELKEKSPKKYCLLHLDMKLKFFW